MAKAQIDVKNILVGHGNLYYAENYVDGAPVDPKPTATSEIDALFAASDGDPSFNDTLGESGDWKYLGATQEGVEIAYAPEYGEIEVDQLGDAAVMFFERSTVTMNTQLAEATLENLLVAWGFADDFLQQAQDSEQFSIGVQASEPVERSVAVVGKGAATTGEGAAPAGSRRERVYFGRRVLSIEGSSLALRRAENTAYPVSFRLLADPNFENSEYGIIIDRIPGDTDPILDPDFTQGS